jgi:hypothetical protein
MTLPAYLTALNLPALPQDYPWDTEWFNTFWATTNEDNPRLSTALGMISLRSTFSLAVACSEWVIARVDGHTDVTDAMLRTEAAWAATLDWRYAELPMPDPTPASAPAIYASPLRLAMKLTAYAHETIADTLRGVYPCTRGLAMLVDHIAGRHPAFGPWLEASLRLAHKHFPDDPNTPFEQQPLVPKPFFEPNFIWRDDMAQASLEDYVVTLDPARNKYLRTPAAMQAAGFSGTPYTRTV